MMPLLIIFLFWSGIASSKTETVELKLTSISQTCGELPPFLQSPDDEHPDYRVIFPQFAVQSSKETPRKRTSCVLSLEASSSHGFAMTLDPLTIGGISQISQSDHSTSYANQWTIRYYPLGHPASLVFRKRLSETENGEFVTKTDWETQWTSCQSRQQVGIYLELLTQFTGESELDRNELQIKEVRIPSLTVKPCELSMFY